MSDYQPFVTDAFKRLMTLMEQTEAPTAEKV
jgi:hypothetical protein